MGNLIVQMTFPPASFGKQGFARWVEQMLEYFATKDLNQMQTLAQMHHQHCFCMFNKIVLFLAGLGIEHVRIAFLLPLPPFSILFGYGWKSRAIYFKFQRRKSDSWVRNFLFYRLLLPTTAWFPWLLSKANQQDIAGTSTRAWNHTLCILWPIERKRETKLQLSIIYLSEVDIYLTKNLSFLR